MIIYTYIFGSTKISVTALSISLNGCGEFSLEAMTWSYSCMVILYITRNVRSYFKCVLKKKNLKEVTYFSVYVIFSQMDPKLVI